MKRVILESPYGAVSEAGVIQHVHYARQCMKDCLMRGEAPYASHLLYTQCLDDRVQAERSLGMDAGWVWMKIADEVVVYTDLGLSSGMQAGISQAESYGLPVTYRRLPEYEPLQPGQNEEYDRALRDLEPNTISEAEIPFKGTIG